MLSLSDIQHHSEFDNFELLASQIVEGFITGLHRSPFHGFSVEFAEHRLYNTGESTKHIDWKLYGRTDKLFVKRYEEETNLRCHIVIDTSSSMLFPYGTHKTQNKLSFSLYTAAALIHLLRRQRDAVGLTLFNQEIDVHTHAKLSIQHAQSLYNHLYNTLQAAHSKDSFNKPNRIAQAIHQVADMVHKRSLIIICSDFFEQSSYESIFAALRHATYNKHEVLVFHILDSQFEEQFAFENRPLKITDMESGKIVKVQPETVRNTYIKNVESITKNLALACSQHAIDYYKADTQQGFSNVLLQYLIKRNKLL